MSKETVVNDRHEYIGGSDIPIIMGLSDFKTRWQLAREKAQIIEPDFKGNLYTRYGDTMEVKIRDYINELFDMNYKPDCFYPKENVRINVDGFDSDNFELLEIKTTSRADISRDAIKDYFVQAYWYMHWIKEMAQTEEYPACRLAIYQRPDDCDEELNPMLLCHAKITSFDCERGIDEVLQAVDGFLELVELLKIKPDTEEIEVLPVEVQNTALKVIELEDKILALSDTEKELKTAKKELYDIMMKNKVKSFKSYGGIGVTLVFPTEDKEEDAFDLDKFKEEHPKYFDKYQTKKIKKGKAGYIRITR